MATNLAGLAYGAAQGLRVAWYYGQKLAAARAQTAQPAPPARPLAEKGREAAPGKGGEALPDRARILGDLAKLLARDWRNIADGLYRMPVDLIPDPGAELRRSRLFFADLAKVEARRRANDHSEVMRQMPQGGYPRYYLQNFHFQTDGYLSRHSAELYDHQVEVLFGGGAAAMRRQALVPLRAAVARSGARTAKLLDLGCGTGSFLREVKSNYPRLAVTALDLSPFYLAEARRLLAPWSRCDFIAAAAEDVPRPGQSFDVVTAIYLFHELPPGRRRAVAGEIARLLKPGGTFILLDSLQRGDTPGYDGLLDRFPLGFHEPYYASYVRSDLAAVFGAAGLVAESAEPVYFSKLATFRKPGPAHPG
jgi:ubiquinone/menaquinone biosynthesis C-methylase UbiE